MAYTTINKGSSYFNTVLYTGNGAARSITGVGFQPDWVWIKKRNNTGNHNLTDVIRGVDKIVFTNSANGESTFAGGISSFDSDGFSLAGNDTGFNASADTYVSWNWLANNTSGSSNTAGTITSTVAANTTAGFSIATYTGNGVSGATVGHGLGVAPKLQMIKKRSGISDWAVVGSFSPFGTLKRIAINGTTAMGTPADIYPTLPTSTVFSPGDSGDTNGNGSTYIAYSFAEIKGFSKFGAYTGNASTDGPFIYTGFKPAWVMIKQTSASGESWYMTDNKRGPFNLITPYLTANEQNAEGTANMQDYLSNGFKIRGSGSYENGSGATYIYMAFAENPFVSSTSIPTTAR
jgi:hypothetical protein